MVGRILLMAVAFAAGAFVALNWLDSEEPEVTGATPRVEQRDPAPGDPPVVWVSGTLTAVTDARLEVQEGEGPTIRMERFAAGATSFQRLRGGRWRELPEARAEEQVGSPVCVEALHDEGDFLALRVFLDTTCSPRP